jgi:hypothetical protein
MRNKRAASHILAEISAQSGINVAGLFIDALKKHATA